MILFYYGRAGKARQSPVSWVNLGSATCGCQIISNSWLPCPQNFAKITLSKRRRTVFLFGGNPMDFRERLFNLRRQAGLSQEELANLLGLTRQAVQKWEAGTSRPDMDNLTALAGYFHVSLDYLVTGKQSAYSPPPPDDAPAPPQPQPSSTTTTTRAGTTNIKVSAPCSACPWSTSTSAAETTGPGESSLSATSPPGSWLWAALPRVCSPWAR